MNNHIVFTQAERLLKQNSIPYETLDLGNGYLALLVRYGGRLLGPFRGESGESVLWVNGAMGDDEAFAAFVAGRQVHLGGERFWINPELRFFCESPEKFNSTYTVQDDLDPGHYRLSRREGTVCLSLEGILKALDTGEEKRFAAERRYFAAPNPLSWYRLTRALPVEYCGYTQEIDLTDLNPEIPIPLEPWTVTQVNPAGRYITPYFGDFEFVDYFTPVGGMQKVMPGYAECRVTGDRNYKVAYRAASTCGRTAFLRELENGQWHLMIRNYYSDPSVPYTAGPWGEPGNRGCSLFLYNDDGSNGGFGELENSGITVGAGTGRSKSTSVSSTWFFFGDQGSVAKIMRGLLGIDYRF